jgi:N-methylhydantoinase B/oxoprolinase/acetone carboxylase alpha subunit
MDGECDRKTHQCVAAFARSEEPSCGSGARVRCGGLDEGATHIRTSNETICGSLRNLRPTLMAPDLGDRTRIALRPNP